MLLLVLVPCVALGFGSVCCFRCWFRVLLLVMVPRVAFGVGFACCFWCWFHVLLLVLGLCVAFGGGSVFCSWCWFHVLLLVLGPRVAFGVGSACCFWWPHLSLVQTSTASQMYLPGKPKETPPRLKVFIWIGWNGFDRELVSFQIA